MSRDLKHKPQMAKSSSAKRSGGGTLLGVFIGLVFGILIAFGLVWYLNKAPMPFQDKSNRSEHLAPVVSGSGAVPEPLPGKPGDKPVEKPRFEFYKILPGAQEATPAPAATVAEKPEVPLEQFYLQAGAFQKPADADNLKAKLALLGAEASVQETAVADKGTMHRVRLGPYASPEDMNRVRNQLAQNGIQATVVKVKVGGN
ncbi:MAG: SPOR domain-containing protein [Rhodocyclaceae bacterium]|nr:SPOR domain-containing protein [Rhodocyclaceae bacterium]